MNLKVVFTVNTVAAFIFGLAFLLMPVQIASIYGLTLDGAGVYVARLLGAAFIGYGVLVWQAKDWQASPARRAVVMALFIGFALGLAASLLGQLAGVTNVLGWLTVVIYLMFTLAYGYFQFVRPG